MLREIIEPIALFAAPFVAYCLVMLLLEDVVPKGSQWSRGHVSALTLAGLALAAAGVLLFGLSAERHLGVYTPAHIEDGQLVGGQITK